MTTISDIDETELPAMLQGLGQVSSGATAAALKVGSRGPAVSDMQKLLVSFGYPLEVDGIFGAKSAAAVKLVQQKLGLVPTGIWDATTRSRVLSIVQSGIIDASAADKTAVVSTRPPVGTSSQVLTIAPTAPGEMTVDAGGSIIDRAKAMYYRLSAKYPWYPYALVGGAVVVGIGLFALLAPSVPKSSPAVAGLGRAVRRRKPTTKKRKARKSSKKRGA